MLYFLAVVWVMLIAATFGNKAKPASKPYRAPSISYSSHRMNAQVTPLGYLRGIAAGTFATLTSSLGFAYALFVDPVSDLGGSAGGVPDIGPMIIAAVQFSMGLSTVIFTSLTISFVIRYFILRKKQLAESTTPEVIY